MVVDNSRGADAGFADSLQAQLQRAGFEVELRKPADASMFDTSVHFVVEGVAIRVPADCGRDDLDTISKTVREAEERRSQRRRYRSVPIYAGETQRVLRWVDVFAG